MTARTVFLFSGQGSQYFQMGAPLYQRGGPFRRSMDRMDEMLQGIGGGSVVATLYGGRSKHDPFDDLALTTPALFMVEVALAETLIEAGVTPHVTLGASHGAFAASVVAGCISVETGLRLALRQAQIVQAECARGGMIAVLSPPQLFDAPALHEHAVIAAHHFSKNFVLSARQPALGRIEAFLKSRDVLFQRLPVRYPFHSPWIDAAQAPFLAAAAALHTHEARIPMLCCATAGYVERLPADYFWTAARMPIQFSQTILQLEQEGPSRYIDVGPSGSMATFLKYLLPASSASSITPLITPFGRDAHNLDALLALQA
jgi:acyl transferase domain-containing protein